MQISWLILHSSILLSALLKFWYVLPFWNIGIGQIFSFQNACILFDIMNWCLFVATFSWWIAAESFETLSTELGENSTFPQLIVMFVSRLCPTWHTVYVHLKDKSHSNCLFHQCWVADILTLWHYSSSSTKHSYNDVTLYCWTTVVLSWSPKILGKNPRQGDWMLWALLSLLQQMWTVVA